MSYFLQNCIKANYRKKDFLTETCRYEIKAKMLAVSKVFRPVDIRMILDQEGLGIPSGAYRGPDCWYASEGISVRQLWEQYLKSSQ